MATFAPLPASAVFCPLPGAFEEGRIGGYWVGILLDFDGTPHGPHDATVYETTLSPGPAGGIALTTLARVQALGEGAAELRAMFIDDKLYVVNSRYAPGSSDKQYEYFAIQRFGILHGKLVSEAEGILDLSRLPDQGRRSLAVDCSEPSGFDKALRKVIESGKLDQIWTPLPRSAAP